MLKKILAERLLYLHTLHFCLASTAQFTFGLSRPLRMNIMMLSYFHSHHCCSECQVHPIDAGMASAL